MSKQKNQINRILELISRWLAEIQGGNALSYYDINKISEGTVMELLNLVYNYKLVDLNLEKENFPGIDLGDDKSGIAFQVTSQTGAIKIRRSLEAFRKNGFIKRFHMGMKMFVLTFSTKKPLKINGFTSTFNPKKDIINLGDLLKAINLLYRTDNARFNQVLELLENEFGEPIAAKPRSPLLKFRDISHSISFYKTYFKTIHEPGAKDFVPFQCSLDGKPIEVTSFFDGEIQLKRMIIAGPSGLGKSMLCKRLSIESFDKGKIPVFVEAKYFEKNLEALIFAEISKAGFATTDAFFAACRRVGKQVILVVDGFNECTGAKQGQLIAEIGECLNQYDLELIVSLQVYHDIINDLKPGIVSIGLPTLDVKKTIALRFSSFTTRMLPLLDAAATGLEAKMIGEIGSDGVEGISRFGLFDLFIRKLIPGRPDCLTLLSAVADILSRQISFSISSRQMDSLIGKHGITGYTLEHALKSGLLEQKLDRFSFSHEMFMDFFAAESIIRSAAGAVSIIKEINLPKHRNTRLLVLGCIEDTNILIQVLSNIEDPKLINGIIHGECGLGAKDWAERKMTAVMEKLERECKQATFELTSIEYYPIKVQGKSLLNWNDVELAFIKSIPFLLANELIFERLFRMVGIMEQTSLESYETLLKEAQARKIGFRGAIFTTIYASFSNIHDTNLALSKLFSTIRSGFLSLEGRNEIPNSYIIKILEKQSLNNGEFFLLLLLCRYDQRAKLLFPYILGAIKNNWRGIPYHLKTEILDQGPHSIENEEQRLALIEALDSVHGEGESYLLNSHVTDTLSNLGALDEDAQKYEKVVCGKLQELLRNVDDHNACNEIGGIYSAQFDHPLSNAYSMAISHLSEKEAILFYKMALNGNVSTFFKLPLILSAESILKADCCQYLLKLMDRPIPEPSMPQDGFNCFLVSYIILGRFNYPLVTIDYDRASEKDIRLLASGELLYWLNRTDLSDSQKRQSCENAVNIFFDNGSAYVIESLWETKDTLRNYSIRNHFEDSIVDINTFFPDRIVLAARSAITNPGSQKGIFGFDREDEIILHAILLLERYGSSIDLEVLLPLTEHSFYGVNAVEAVRSLQG